MDSVLDMNANVQMSKTLLRKTVKRQKKKKETIFDAGLHVKGHVVRLSVRVGVSDVGDGTDRHGDLAQRVDDGQVDNSPAKREER